MKPQKVLILASSSRYRQALLQRLGLSFEVRVPNVDETACPGEGAAALASRLAAAKAAAVAAAGALVIGSDQAPDLDGQILRKPGNKATAIEQLLACRGKSVLFHTAVHLLDTTSGQHWSHTDRTEIQFLDLPEAAIERYVEVENPIDSAGGFKAEGLGITLFREMRTEDPTALIGLPLIALSRLLRTAGIEPLSPSGTTAS